MTWLNPRLRLADAAGSVSESEELSRRYGSDGGAQLAAARVVTRGPEVSGDDDVRYSEVVCSDLLTKQPVSELLFKLPH